MSLNDDYNTYVHPSNEVDFARLFQTIAGGGLIFVGIGVTLWLVWQIYAVITNPTNFDLIAALYPPEGDSYTIFYRNSGGENEIVFPAIFVQVFGYYIIARLLGVVVQIINGMIANGNNLLQASRTRPAESESPR